MPNFLSRLRTLLPVALLLPAPGAVALEPVDYLELDELVYAIRVAIRDTVRDQDREPYFLITGIELELKGVETAEVGGGFKIPIFESSASAEAVRDYSATHALAMDLSPNQPIATRPVPDIQLSRIVGEVKDSFYCEDPEGGDGDEEAVVETAGESSAEAAAETAQEAAETPDAPECDADEETVSEETAQEDLPDLVATRFTYTYSGALKEKLGGGFDLILFKIGGEVTQSGLQTIAFTLCRTYNKQNCAE